MSKSRTDSSITIDPSYYINLLKRNNKNISLTMIKSAFKKAQTNGKLKEILNYFDKNGLTLMDHLYYSINNYNSEKDFFEIARFILIIGFNPLHMVSSGSLTCLQIYLIKNSNHRAQFFGQLLDEVLRRKMEDSDKIINLIGSLKMENSIRANHIENLKIQINSLKEEAEQEQEAGKIEANIEIEKLGSLLKQHNKNQTKFQKQFKMIAKNLHEELLYRYQNSDYEAMKLLINMGADVNYQDENGETILYSDYDENKEEILKLIEELLVENNINIFLSNKRNKIAATVASEKNIKYISDRLFRILESQYNLADEEEEVSTEIDSTGDNSLESESEEETLESSDSLTKTLELINNKEEQNQAFYQDLVAIRTLSSGSETNEIETNSEDSISLFGFLGSIISGHA
ncbi:MAG: hypothetical protein WBJ81_04345 [Rickettsiales bacterium]